MSTTSDRFATDLWDATASTFGTAGSVTIPLNAGGVAAIQDWVTTPANNFGLTIQYMGATNVNADYWMVDSTENTSGHAPPTLNVTYSTPGPSITTSGTLSAFSAPVGTPSAQQSYTVAGTSLTDAIVITPPADFDLSLTSGSGFSSSPISLTPTGGTVATTTIYVRFKRTTAGTSSGNITHTSTGATTQNMAVSGTAGDPLLSTNGTLTIFSSTAAVASAEQSFTVSGNYLVGDVTLSAPTDFQVSTTSGSGFGSSVTLTPINYQLSSTTIYVRMNCSTAGSSTGNIAVSSSGATTQNVAALGTAYVWVAYNDCSWQSDQINTNITTLTCNTDTAGLLLKNYATGANTVVTAGVNVLTNHTAYPANGNYTNAGTDAYNTFYGKASMVGVINYNTTTGWYIDVILTGLDPAKTYTFITSVNRADASMTWNSKFTISDVDAATNASTSGVTPINDYSVSFNAGYNTVNGYVARWTGIQPGADGDFTVRSEHANSGDYYGYGPGVFMLAEEAPSGPTITTLGTLTAFSAPVGTPSGEQSYTVSGSNLTDAIVITPPADFEISLTSGSGWVANPSTISLTPTSGTVSATTIYVRFTRSSAGTSSGNITHTSTGATTKDVVVSGTAGTPTITTTSSMTAFSQAVGAPSSEQTYTIAGDYLAGDITVTAPADFEISKTTGSGFVSSLTFAPTNNTLATTMVYVRMNRSSAGSSSGDITHASPGATTQNVAVSGTASLLATFQEGVSSYAGTLDTYILENTLTTSYGTETSFGWDTDDPATSGKLKVGLLRFDNIFGDGAGLVPVGSTIISATLQYYVSNTGVAADVNEVLVDWSEAETWNSFGGDAGVQADEYGNSLGQTTGTTSTGSKTLSVTASVTSWAASPSANKGWVFRQGGTDGVDVSSRENTTTTNRPKLSIRYIPPPPGPTITTSGALTAFSSQPGVPSAAQTYTVGGSNLTEDILITPPTGFELSTDGSNYYPSLTLTQSGGAVGTTTLYVRLNSATEGTFSGNIAHTSSGATTKNVAASGTVLYVYTLTVGNDGHGSVTLSPTGGSYNNGTIVTLTPVPDSGYKFGDWSGDNALDIVNTSGVYTIVMNGNKTVYANFAVIPQYTLTTSVTPVDGGSVTLNPSGGTYAENTVVTLTAVPGTGFAFSAWSGDLSGGANPTTITMDNNKIVEAIFVPAQSCATVNLVPSADNYISGYSTSMNNNYGASTTIKSTRDADNPRGTLFKWDVSSIPSNASVSSASLTLYISTAAAQTYNLYNMRRDWVEGTGASSVTNDGATWYTYDGVTGHTWGANGAADTTTDRFDANLWGADTTSFATTGSKMVSFNTNGLAVVQGWIAGTLSNYGLTMQNYSTSTTINDDLQLASRENATVANRPKLNITYCVPAANYTLSVTNDGHGTVTVSPESATYEYGTTVTLTPVPNSGYQFAYWSGANAEDPTDNGNGTWSLFMDSDKVITANFSLQPVNVAPNPPMLVQPLDTATGVSTSPTLEVMVSDGNTLDTLDVSFYGRIAGTTAGDDFMLVVIPDSQNEAQYYPAVMYSQFQWIANNKTSQNIVFATSVGDIVNTSSSTTQYGVADTAYDYLDAATVSYSVSPGNHDLGGLFNTYFGISRFTGKSWYGGYYGSDNYNNYSLFSASGNNFILINLQYSPATAQLDWADALLKANPTRRGIVVQHNILNTDNSWNSQTSYNALKDNPNLFLMLCGHMHTSTDGAAYRAELGDDGHTIHIMMADYQDYPNGGNGYLRLLRFSPADDKIYATTYSPTAGSITSYPDQMEMVYDLTNGSAAAYTLIGNVNDVANGANASITWPGLTASTGYEWYATVSDGTEMVTGSTWSFTTGTGNVPPVITEGESTLVDMSEDGSPTAFDLTLHATDGNVGDTLTWSIATQATNGTASASGTGASMTVGYTPIADYGGTDVFVVQVSDGNGGTDSITVNVNIAPVNDAPVLGAIGNKSVVELNLLTFTAAATDVDLPANTLTFTLADGTSGSVPAGAAIDPNSGVFTWTPATAGSYTFDVCVSDGAISDCETITVTVTAVQLTHSISLQPGWNLVSFNLIPVDSSITAVLASIDGHYTLVEAWSDGAWLVYDPNPLFVDTLTALHESMGFWIYMTVADTLDVSGTAPEQTSIELQTGWNLVAFPSSATSLALPGALTSNGVPSGALVRVYAFNSTNTADPWKIYDPAAPPYANDLAALQPGWGYWIYVSADCTWQISY